MTITALVTVLLKHVGLLVAGAFVLLTISPVQELNFKKNSIYNRLFLIVFFGLFGILGTYSGNAIFNSIANLRAMAVVTAGLFGGPVVGLGAGLLAGGHRFFIDPWGFSAFPCSLATVLEGVIAGYIHLHYKERSMDWTKAMLIALVGETMHMALVLLFSRPFDQALELVQVIALPMLVGNTLGAGLFVHVILSLQEFREKKDSTQAHKIFDIANNTVRHLRGGLTMETALATAKIIHQRMPVAAVAITDSTHVLAHVGAGGDHHLKGKPIRTRATRNVIATGKPIFLKNSNHIGCNHSDCPFHSAIIVPLKKGSSIVGTLKLYGSSDLELNRIQFEIAKGLTDLFSIQLELEDIQVKDTLLAHAKIKHLQAQINPHFLFNSLNTIASFCRTKPEKARDLILDLSLYMRKNLDSSRGFVKLESELEQINSYLAIEKARFGDLIQIHIDVEPGCNEWPIPSLIIQPLIENGIKHGIRSREGGGTISLIIYRNMEVLEVTVKDDGKGIDQKILSSLLIESGIQSHTEGVGLRNSNQRLKQFFGVDFGMEISSSPEKGTSISFRIPKMENYALSPA